MAGSLTTVRRTGLLLVVVLGAVAAAGSVQGGTGQGVPPQSAVDAASANWAAKAKLLDANGRPQFDQLPPLAAIDAASANWAAKAELLDADGLPLSGETVSPASGSSRFDWGGLGIRGAAVVALVLLAMGLLAATHYRRKGSLPRSRVS